MGLPKENRSRLAEPYMTTRDKGKPDAVPMCGVPVHGVDPYLKRLTELGHRVAICEQTEAPSKTARASMVLRFSAPC